MKIKLDYLCLENRIRSCYVRIDLDCVVYKTDEHNEIAQLNSRWSGVQASNL